MSRVFIISRLYFRETTAVIYCKVYVSMFYDLTEFFIFEITHLSTILLNWSNDHADTINSVKARTNCGVPSKH